VLWKIAGAIPSEFCASTGTSIDVEGTDIKCYSGCLTSSAVLVTGASPDCHNGSILREFLIFGAVAVSLILMFSLAYRLRYCMRPSQRDEGISAK